MTIYRDTSLLHPKFRRVAERLDKRLMEAHQTGKTKTVFKIFETFRSPSRQKDLIAKGVTKAGPYQSAHQFGLAVDFVAVIDAAEANALSELRGERRFPGWSWDPSHDWDYLTKEAKALGLVTIDWDRPHVQHPEWYDIIHKLNHLTYLPK